MMYFWHYLLEIDKIDKALYDVQYASENIGHLEHQIFTLESEDAQKNAQQIEELKSKKNALDKELASKHEETEVLIDALSEKAKKQAGSGAEVQLRKIISNIKINRKIIPDPDPVSPQAAVLPADLLKVMPEASNHGFRLKMYRELLAYTQFAHAIENNGSPEEHAYRLAILFDNPDANPVESMKHVRNYWKMVALAHSDNPQFLHDSCLFDVPEGENWTVEAWRKFVRDDLQNFVKQTKGIALCLPEAERIEKKLLERLEEIHKQKWLAERQAAAEKRAKKLQKKEGSAAIQPRAAALNPQYLHNQWREEWLKKRPDVLSQVKTKEIAEIYAGLSFERGKENPAAASLFRKYGLSENNFNTYLSLVPRDSDEIPDVLVDGRQLSSDLRNYYIKKLDPRDPMCAMLGKKTGCCQYIGNAGGPCAIHGITSEHGGFYVLCAGNSKNPKNTDDIRAQCWAWRSESGALVFDSIEATKPIMESTVGAYQGKEMVGLMYAVLAKVLVETPRFGIPAVHVGTGGNTPDMLGLFQAKSEQPIDYKGYRDSINQRVIVDRAQPEMIMFYEALNAFIELTRDPKPETNIKINNLIDKCSLKDFICILAQVILIDPNKTILNKKVIDHLFDQLAKKDQAAFDRSEQMLSIIPELLRANNQLERAELLYKLYDSGMDLHYTFVIPEDGEYSTLPGNKNILEVLLKANDWEKVDHLLELGMPADKGNVLLWAITDMSQAFLQKKMLSGEQITLIRRLIQSGADYNAEVKWMSDQAITPLDVLILTGNDKMVKEFLSLNLDKNKGQPIASALMSLNIEMMDWLIEEGFSLKQGDVIAWYIRTARPVILEQIDRLVHLGAPTESESALFCAMNVYDQPDLIMQLLDRNIFTTPQDALDNLFVNLVSKKRYDVINRIIHQVKDYGGVTYAMEINPATGYMWNIPKTPLVRLIEDHQYDLAKRLIDLGASLEVQKHIPEQVGLALKDDHTNYVLAACLAQHDEEASLLALEAIAKGAPFDRVDLYQLDGEKTIGQALVDLAERKHHQVALQRLKKEGFVPTGAPQPAESEQAAAQEVAEAPRRRGPGRRHP